MFRSRHAVQMLSPEQRIFRDLQKWQLRRIFGLREAISMFQLERLRQASSYGHSTIYNDRDVSYLKSELAK